jgi:hypothetical protein
LRPPRFEENGSGVFPGSRFPLYARSFSSLTGLF